MATVLRSFDWSQVSRNSDTPRTRSYPWEQWFDGRIWQLEPDEDFSGPPVSLERVIRTTANRRGAKVRVRITEDGYVIVQRHDGAPERGITKSPTLKSIREAQTPTVNGNGTAPAKAKRKLIKS